MKQNWHPKEKKQNHSSFSPPQSQSELNALLKQYEPLVKKLAQQIQNNFGKHLDLDELMQMGRLGLVQAIERFDPKRGVNFENYCSKRISGAILDELRRQDWVPRLVRQQASKLQKAYAELQAKLGRPPHENEVAQYLEMNLAEYHHFCQKALPHTVHSLTTPPSPCEDANPLQEIIDSQA
ncbi:MAG: sigma-70 family RNA polymerase sigma factor, partial [Planctomycetota bacterium]